MTSSLSDLESVYFATPTLPILGIVRTISPFATSAIPVATPPKMHYMRVQEGGTISALRISIVVGSTGNICVAVHKNTGKGLNAKPGTLLATTGSLVCPSTGVNTLPLGQSVNVQAGDWFSLGSDDIAIKFTGQAGADGSAALVHMSLGMYGWESVFPAPPVANYLPTNARMFSVIGVP